MKKVLEGWLGGHYDDLSLHRTKEDAERSVIFTSSLDDDLMEFENKKIRITVELIEE